jgi:hypothetical protein
LELTKQEFLKLLRYKTTITEMIQAFEEKFFIKYQGAIAESLTPYRKTLETQSFLLAAEAQQNPTNEGLHITISQVQQQLLTIQKILQAPSLDELMELIPAYLYLKQQVV